MPEAGRPAWVDDELFPFESRFIGIDGHTVHYVDEGSGPTLLLLHGNPTWSFVYRDVIRALRDEFRCVAVDYPGFGLSSAGPATGICPKSTPKSSPPSLTRSPCAGSRSWPMTGVAPSASPRSAQRPTAFTGLVLANTWAWPITGAPHVEVASYLMGGPLGRLLNRQFNLFVNAMIPAGHRLRNLTPAEMAHFRQPFAIAARRDAAAVFARRITASRAFLGNVEAGLGDLATLPTLIVWGGADFAFRAKERQRWERIFDDHHTVVVEGAGHFVQSDAPDQFAAALRDSRAGSGGPNVARTDE